MVTNYRPSRCRHQPTLRTTILCTALLALTASCAEDAVVDGGDATVPLADSCDDCDASFGGPDAAHQDASMQTDATEADDARADVPKAPDTLSEDAQAADALAQDAGGADTVAAEDTGPGEDTGAPDAGPPSPCGNGILDPGELCDADCPANCDDGLAYTLDIQTGSPSTCDITCTWADSGLDTDGDTLTDYQELFDDLDTTNPWVFNGLTATIGKAPSGFFTSADCDLFFGDDFGAMMNLFEPPPQQHAISSGWKWSAGNSPNYDDASQYDFVPAFEHHDNVGVHNSFQIHLAGTLHVPEDATWCFSVDTDAGGFGPLDIAGRRNNCGRVFIDPTAGAAPLAETGYGSAESPNTGCVDLTAGSHAIHFAARHYETHLYKPRFEVRYCVGAGCTPTQSLTQADLYAVLPGSCLPSCTGTDTCEPDGCGGTCGQCGPCEGPDCPCEGPDCPCEGPDCPCEGPDCPCEGPDCPCEGPDCPCEGPDCPCEGPDCPPAGACTNAADMTIINELGPDGLEDAITPCGTSCFLSGDKQSCVRSCINEDIGLTSPCADCYAATTVCTINNCAGPCIDGGDDCTQCMVDSGCQDAFPACSGLTF